MRSHEAPSRYLYISLVGYGRTRALRLFSNIRSGPYGRKNISRQGIRSLLLPCSTRSPGSLRKNSRCSVASFTSIWTPSTLRSSSETSLNCEASRLQDRRARSARYAECVNVVCFDLGGGSQRDGLWLGNPRPARRQSGSKPAVSQSGDAPQPAPQIMTVVLLPRLLRLSVGHPFRRRRSASPPCAAQQAPDGSVGALP